jgi:predicted dehydrogenase
LDPEKAGSGAVGDIGTHAFHLACHVTGWQPQDVSAVLKNYHASRRLDDYGHVLIDFGEDRLGAITFSQTTHGRLNALTLEVDGSHASLAWRQEDPNQLEVRRTGQAMQVYERHPTATHMTDASRRASRLPGGHPEGFFEAFANIYRAAFDDIVRHNQGHAVDCQSTNYPNVVDGMLGVAFVVACQTSNKQRGAWIALDRRVDALRPPH